MVWELCDREPLQPVHLPRLMKLLLDSIPLPPHFLLGFADLSRCSVSGFVFLTLFFLFVGRHELQNSAGSWANVCSGKCRPSGITSSLKSICTCREGENSLFM